MPQQLSRHERLKLFAGDTYQDHQLLWRLFDEEQRSFIYRREQGNTQYHMHLAQSAVLPVFYMVSKQLPQTIAGLQVQSKVYEPQLNIGRTFAFDLRINPTIAKRDPNKKHSSRYDILLLANREVNAERFDGHHQATRIKQAADTWLLQRAEQYGFSIQPDGFTHDRHQVHRFVKTKSRHKVQVSSLDYQGLLTVQNTELFRQTLYEGMGRARGFGCGMMMIRKI